MTVIIYNVK